MNCFEMLLKKGQGALTSSIQKLILVISVLLKHDWLQDTQVSGRKYAESWGSGQDGTFTDGHI